MTTQRKFFRERACTPQSVSLGCLAACTSVSVHREGGRAAPGPLCPSSPRARDDGKCPLLVAQLSSVLSRASEALVPLFAPRTDSPGCPRPGCSFCPSPLSRRCGCAGRLHVQCVPWPLPRARGVVPILKTWSLADTPAHLELGNPFLDGFRAAHTVFEVWGQDLGACLRPCLGLPVPVLSAWGCRCPRAVPGAAGARARCPHGQQCPGSAHSLRPLPCSSAPTFGYCGITGRVPDIQGAEKTVDARGENLAYQRFQPPLFFCTLALIFVFYF